MRFQIDDAVSIASASDKSRIAMEVGFRIAERGAAQRQKPVDVPGLEHILVGVEIDREIEEVRHERDRLAVLRQAAGLQHVQALDDEDVRPVDFDPLVRRHVVDQMRIDRRPRRPPPGLHVGEEAQQRRQVVAFRKALLLHQAFALEDRVRIKKAVGGDEVDLGHVRPARQQRLQHARGGRLADRHRAGDADDEGHLDVFGAEEALLRAEQPLRRRHIERQQPRQRQIDLLDFLDVEPVVQRAQARDLFRGQRHRRVVAQRRPFRARERAVGRKRFFGALFHQAFIRLAARGFFLVAGLRGALVEFGLDLGKRDAARFQHDHADDREGRRLPRSTRRLVLLHGSQRGFEGLFAQFFGAVGDAFVEQCAGIGFLRACLGAFVYPFFQIGQGELAHGRVHSTFVFPSHSGAQS